MALATRCPSCNTIFRISTAQAAAKGGMVRCGRCGNVFNSLDALVRVEDLEVIDETSVTPAPTSSDANRVVGVGQDSIEGAASTVEQAVERAVSDPRWLPERIDVPAGTAPPDAAASSRLRDDVDPLLSGRRTDLTPHAGDFEGTNPTFMRPDPDVTPDRRGQHRLFGALTAIAAAALLAQAVYHWRDELAARWSPAKPWLVAACVALRCQVDFPAHIGSITIESAGIQSAGSNLNVYVMTALLRNRDAVDLRYPHLELVLTDLQDRPMLRRVLRPEDYLPAAAGGTNRTGFLAESELPIRVMFELDDLRFAGYRLDRFYP
ncbi:MAG: DUF3426 domain-containing protein [Burkholderiaceae bacterium]